MAWAADLTQFPDPSRIRTRKRGRRARRRRLVPPAEMIPDHRVGLRLTAGIKSGSVQRSAGPGNSSAPVRKPSPPVPQADPLAPSLLTGLAPVRSPGTTECCGRHAGWPRREKAGGQSSHCVMPSRSVGTKGFNKCRTDPQAMRAKGPRCQCREGENLAVARTSRARSACREIPSFLYVSFRCL